MTPPISPDLGPWQPIVLEGLTRLNVILSSITVLIAFSLLAYLFVYNFRNAVARSYVALLTFTTLVYIGDVFLSTARLPAEHPAATFWLSFQWLGIPFVAPAFLHFTDALLATTGDRSSRRRWALILAYLGGAAALITALASDVLVGAPSGAPGSVRFSYGPGFPVFFAYYTVLATWATRNLILARRRALTGRSHRRMTYLLVSAIAPMSTFPWLVLGGEQIAGRSILFGAIIAAASMATALMLVVVAYSVAYHGAIIPERNVKRELIKYLIQGPVLGAFVLAMAQLVPERLDESLGMPRDVIFMLITVFGIVAYQLLVRALKPLIDQLIYGDVGRDAIWLRRLDERLLTAEDLAQLLENILAALCDRLRVSTGCVLVTSQGRPRLEVFTGDPARSTALLAALDADSLSGLSDDEPFGELAGFWVHTLRPPGGEGSLGLLAIEHPGRSLTPQEDADFRRLIASAERAMEDRLIQQRVLDALRELEPELEGIQRLRGSLQPGAETPLGLGAEGDLPDDQLAESPEFSTWVRDALAHYWGGPKLSESPLLELPVVREAMNANPGNPTQAMRSVLDHALERLKPEGERSLTGSQWVLYNILELKFVRRLKVREIASRLAISESDLYRKQRVAIEALAAQLASMEGASVNGQDLSTQGRTAESAEGSP